MHHQLELPPGMRSKLEDFRRRVWIVKIAEGALAAIFGLLLSYLVVFLLDRVWDTPAVLRLMILLAGTAGLGVWFPWKCHRWVWNTRGLEQVARLLRHGFPRLGDQLLGIIELAHSEREQERSGTLVRAAMQQVDAATRDKDFSAAVPHPRHRHWAWAVAVPAVLALLALTLVPAAGTNALARWLFPWRHTERYTFAQLDQLPKQLVVPYAERFEVQAPLSESTAWSPRQGTARYDRQQPVRAGLQDGGYTFDLPPQKDVGTLTVSVGDAKKRVEVQPTTRPELTTMTAHVELPEYLQYSAGLTKDVRGGSVSLVKGSQASFVATATRELAEATVDGRPERVDGEKLVTTKTPVQETATHRIAWRDRLGLSAKEPFVLTIHAVDDEPPVISSNFQNREQIVLDEEVLSFEVRSEDDFGVRMLGLEWVGVEDPLRNPHPDKGEKIVAGGEPEKRGLEVVATFCAKTEGIKPQTLEIRLFTVDYLPGRERTYSPTYLVHVLSPEEHAMWLTAEFQKWFRHAQETYEREQQLHETNKQLRDLPPEEVDRPENRRRIESQAAAEQANARRLSALTDAGDQLVKQAARNSQFNVATLENWAAMMQALKNIADQRMPSVADLLKEAASAPGTPSETGAEPSPSEPQQSESAPKVGENRDPRSGGPGKSKPSPPSKVPSIVDVESSFNELDQEPKKDDEESPPGTPKFGLPSTVVQGGGAKQEGKPQPGPTNQKLDEAVEEQEDLLAEFAKVADELKKILNNLEASTFVKRLKAASRRQLEVASDLNEGLGSSFGQVDSNLADANRQMAEKLAEREVAQSDNLYVIEEDLEAYFNRVQEGKFKTVLNEMRDMNVVANLRDVADSVRGNLNGQSIAETEFWADNLDRWAEQLVGPG